MRDRPVGRHRHGEENGAQLAESAGRIRSADALPASAAIHRTAELGELQDKLQGNITAFDRAFPTELAGNRMPVRQIAVGEEEKAVALSQELYRRGYYCSAVFFPIVARGEAGVRLMMRADIEPAQLDRFCGDAREIMGRL